MKIFSVVVIIFAVTLCGRAEKNASKIPKASIRITPGLFQSLLGSRPTITILDGNNNSLIPSNLFKPQTTTTVGSKPPRQEYYPVYTEFPLSVQGAESPSYQHSSHSSYPSNPYYPPHHGVPSYSGYLGYPSQPSYPGHPYPPSSEPSYSGHYHYQPSQPGYPSHSSYPGYPSQPPYHGYPSQLPHSGYPPHHTHPDHGSGHYSDYTRSGSHNSGGYDSEYYF